MARGDAELRCLNRVRRDTVQHAMSGFLLADQDKWYGLHYENGAENDVALLADMLMSCEPNERPNDFPDFVHARGLIEHFRVSGTERGKSGFESAKLDDKVQREAYKKLSERNQARLEGSSDGGCVSLGITSYETCEPTYEMFCKSFKRHWDYHVQRLNAYFGEKTVVVFMIECSDVGLSMAEEFSVNPEKRAVCVGDLRKSQERFHDLRLSRCEDLLEYMYGFRADVHYVIYVGEAFIEFFRTDELGYVGSFIERPYLKYGCPGRMQRMNMCMTVPTTCDDM